MTPRWFFRMAKWAHNPPGTKRVLLVLGIISACVLLYGVERFIGLPDWMGLEPTRRTRFPTE